MIKQQKKRDKSTRWEFKDLKDFFFDDLLQLIQTSFRVETGESLRIVLRWDFWTPKLPKTPAFWGASQKPKAKNKARKKKPKMTQGIRSLGATSLFFFFGPCGVESRNVLLKFREMSPIWRFSGFFDVFFF